MTQLVLDRALAPVGRQCRCGAPATAGRQCDACAHRLLLRVEQMLRAAREARAA